MKVLEIIAVASWCITAYLVPVVVWIVWRKRKKDRDYVLPYILIDYTRGL